MSAAPGSSQHDDSPRSFDASSNTPALQHDTAQESPKLELAALRTQRNDIHDADPIDSSEMSSGAGVTDSSFNDELGRNWPTHSKQRRSGGFLLDSAYQPSAPPTISQVRTQPSKADVKGKRKSQDTDLFVAKRRLYGPPKPKRVTTHSSPLATEIKMISDLSAGKDIHGHDLPSPRPSNTPPRRVGSTASRNDDVSLEERHHSTNFGFDTDPAQIVNMALSLSEARRRQVSGARILSGDTRTRRIMSTRQSSHYHSSDQRGSISQYLTQHRHVSRNISPKLVGSIGDGQEEHANGKAPISHEYNSPDNSTFRSTEEMGNAFEVSDATKSRVLKAKNHFELFYHYRRLIPHLPPIRNPELVYNAPNEQPQSRVHNPLQYVRNRKLRFRERDPIPSETHGWHDVDQVGAWVDAVITSHNETRHDPRECVRLPELSYHKLGSVDEDQSSMEIDSPASGSRRQSENLDLKPRRPRSDWVTHPGDLIADAFWLEQGLNKTRIEDRDGNKIYRPDTQFIFSGWRNRTPIDAAPMQQSAQSAETLPSPSVLPALPRFTSAATDKNRHRGRREKLRDSLISIPKNGSGFRGPRRKLGRDSSFSGSSEDSVGVIGSRGRSLLSRRGKGKDENIPDSSAQNPLTGRKSRKEPHRLQRSISPESKETSVTTSKRSSMAGEARIFRVTTGTTSRSSSPKGPYRTQMGSLRHSGEQLRGPRSVHEIEQLPRNSADYDTNAPSSPVASAFPSIVIDLSPPPSRSPSPTKRTIPSRINPFTERSKSKQRDGISTNGFVAVPPEDSSRRASSGAENVRSSSGSGSRGTSPTSKGRGPSPMTKKASSPSDDHDHYSETHRGSTISRISTKSSNSHADRPARLRGIFKGGRIAELVGNEVSRVGDFIWKRDPPHMHAARLSSSTSSFKSGHTSDSEGEGKPADGSMFKTTTRTGYQGLQSSADNLGSDRLSPNTSSSPSSGEKPQYHMSNLPIFTSPFQRDRELNEERARLLPAATSSPPLDDHLDHLSRLATHHRSSSRASRLDHLALPKIVTSRASSPTLSLALRDGIAYELGLSRSANASQIFNDAIDNKPDGMPVTALAELRRSRSQTAMAREWSPSHGRAQSDSASNVTRRDIARATALLKASSVRAREISRRANLIREPTPKFLLDSSEPTSRDSYQTSLPHVPRRNEHVFAARNLIASLMKQSDHFRKTLRSFSTEVCPELHTDLQALDDLVDNALIPRVRAAADEAGELSMKLSTTSTLAVKGLNDIIDRALRRRRRGPVKWLRRFGYVLIEWTVVGLLWAIWLFVTVARLLICILKGSYFSIKWLLWL